MYIVTCQTVRKRVGMKAPVPLCDQPATIPKRKVGTPGPVRKRREYRAPGIRLGPNLGNDRLHVDARGIKKRDAPVGHIAPDQRQLGSPQNRAVDAFFLFQAI